MIHLLLPALFAMAAYCQTGENKPQINRRPGTVIQESSYVLSSGAPFTGTIKLVLVRSGKALDEQTFIEVTDGAFSQRIQPTDPDSYYVATFLSQGKVADYQKWEVPEVSYNVRIVDVQRGKPEKAAFNPDIERAADTTAATIPESNVIGLVSDLAARALKGPSYAPGRTAVINSAGLLEGAAGNPTDCMQVGGSSAPCGGLVSAAGDVASATASSGSIQLTVTGIQGYPVSPLAPTNGQALLYSSASGAWVPGAIPPPTVTMGGDVGGTSSTATVTGIQNHPVANTAPANGQGLVYSSTTNTWGPAAVSATLGGDLSGASATATVAGIQNRPVSSTAPADGQTLVYNANANSWAPGNVSATMGGDVSGPSSSTTVTAIQGRSVAATAPSNGQTLVYSSPSWAPGNASAAMGGDISGASGTSTVTGIQNHPVAATAPTNGQALVYASNTWAPGAVTAGMAGDVSGTSATSTVTGIQNHPVASSTPADGQALIYSAAAGAWAATAVTTSSTSVGGDLGGTSSGATVTGIQSRPVAATAPASNQVLTWNATTNQWTPANPTIAEGFSLVQGSSTTATLNTECSATSPCTVRFGSATQQYTGPTNITITASSGTGQLLVYVDNSGSVQVVHNLTNVTCNGQCVASNSSTPAFPLGSIPLWSCSVIVGAWGGSCLDFRAPLSTLIIVPGPGLFAVETADQIVIGVDGGGSSFSNVVSEVAAMTTSGSLENGTCAQRGSMRIPGATPGSTVLAGWGSLPAGVTGSLRVTAADTADILLCNASGATQALAAVKVIARLPQSATARPSAPAGNRVKLHFTSEDLASNRTLEYCYGNEDCTQGPVRGSIPLTICKRSCDVILGGVVGSLRYHLMDGVSRNEAWLEVKADSVR